VICGLSCRQNRLRSTGDAVSLWSYLGSCQKREGEGWREREREREREAEKKLSFATKNVSMLILTRTSTRGPHARACAHPSTSRAKGQVAKLTQRRPPPGTSTTNTPTQKHTQNKSRQNNSFRHCTAAHSRGLGGEAGAHSVIHICALLLGEGIGHHIALAACLVLETRFLVSHARGQRKYRKIFASTPQTL
jgi:hypothetical protein